MENRIEKWEKEHPGKMTLKEWLQKTYKMDITTFSEKPERLKNAIKREYLEYLEPTEGEKISDSKIQDIIKKESEGYIIYSHKGKRLSKAFKTKEEAEKRLKQIEMFKHMKDSSYKGYDIEYKGDLWQVWKDTPDGDKIIAGDFPSEEEAREWIDAQSEPERKTQPKKVLHKYLVFYVDNDSDQSRSIEVEAKSEADAKRIVKNILGRDVYGYPHDAILIDSKKEIKDNMKLPHLDAVLKKLNAPQTFEVDGQIETEPSSYDFKYRKEGDMLKIYDANENYTINYVDDLYSMYEELSYEFNFKMPEKIEDKIHPQIEQALKEDGFGDEVLEWENNVIMSIRIPEKQLKEDTYVEDKKPRFTCMSYFGEKAKGLEDSFETASLDEAKEWIWEKSQKGFAVRIIDEYTGELWHYDEIEDPEELNEIKPYEFLTEDAEEEIELPEEEGLHLWIVSWISPKGNKFTAEFDAKEDAEEFLAAHDDEEHMDLKIKEEVRKIEDCLHAKDHQPKYAIFVKTEEGWKLWGGLEEDEIKRKENVIKKYGKENVKIVPNKNLDEMKKALNEVKDAEQLYIYQFPSDLNKNDIRKLKEFDLELLGRVPVESWDGSELLDFAIKGTKEALERYCSEHLDYIMHPDYLYKAESFPVEILK